MGALTREAILAADDLPKEEVSVPEWGGSVLITSMTGTMRDTWERSIVSADGKATIDNVRAKLVACTAVDETGALLFSPADVDALGAKSGAALDRCARVAQRLNKLTDKELEEVKGN